MLGCRVVYKENDGRETVGIVIRENLKATLRKSKQSTLEVVPELGMYKGEIRRLLVGALLIIEEPNIEELLTHTNKNARQIGQRLLIEKKRQEARASKKTKAKSKLPSDVCSRTDST